MQSILFAISLPLFGIFSEVVSESYEDVMEEIEKAVIREVIQQAQSPRGKCNHWTSY